YNIVGLDLAKSAGLSAVFTITGMMGQIIWPTLSDKIGRRLTLILCGCWMAVSIASFCLIAAIYPNVRHPPLNIRAVIDYFTEIYGDTPYWQN
ncbi:MFS transporter, partial [Acinetobacter baumannii]|uniref:MFS transporter n=1 Tax=Acinetobacter baumannii TaxID=470 RepID=UPI001D16FE21